MKQVIGTKIILARPMVRGLYNSYRGWELPASENANDEGYLVEYEPDGKPNHDKHKGYISWSPKSVFEAAYRPTTSMTFGDALVFLKAGKRVARAGWNGKDMWLSMSGRPGGQKVHMAHFWSEHNRNFAASQRHQEVTVLPAITMKTADGSILMGWLASQTDMLAEDWSIVE